MEIPRTSHIVFTGSSLLQIDFSIVCDMAITLSIKKLRLPILQQVITTILENDLPAVEKVEYVSIKKMKRLLTIVSQMVPSSCFIPKRIICSSLPNRKRYIWKIPT